MQGASASLSPYDKLPIMYKTASSHENPSATASITKGTIRMRVAVDVFYITFSLASIEKR
jgi:hypothetical protein